jgi:hypothetical protein
MIPDLPEDAAILPSHSALTVDVHLGGMRTLLVGYGDQWRKLRTVLHHQLQPRTSETYEPQQVGRVRVDLRLTFTQHRRRMSFDSGRH